MTLAEFARQNGINYRTAQTWLRRGRIQEMDSGFTLAQDSGLRRREDSESPLNPESRSESCAGCESLRARVVALESENNELRERIEAIEGCLLADPSPEVLRNAVINARQSNYATSPARRAAAFEDGDGPMWGA